MTFKRSTLRYGETPQPVTPYQKAAQKWDERIGSSRAQAANWRLMALGSLVLCLIIAAILLSLGRSGSVFPYIVEVDRQGGARPVGPATEVYKPNDAQIAFHLARFIENVRSLSIDAATARDGQGSGAARSLAVTLGLAHDFEHRILADWKRDMLKEMRIPHSPLRRLADTLADVRKSASLQAAALAAFAKDAEPDSTHPSLKERLAALGADGVPSLPALGVPAFESLLPETVRNELPLK